MNLDIEILGLLKGLQTQHGLTYENYQRYRSYCSRRLHRVRRSLNVHQNIQPSAKARHQRGRKLMDVTNSMVLEAGDKDPEYAQRMLIIPLTLAERAWSYAMQLKQETNEQPRRRYHLVRRLKKASEHAKRFEKLCNDPDSPCSDRTKAEATAYSSYITGMYNMESEQWADAKKNLSKAYEFYFKASIWIRDEINQEHYRQRIDELRASLRYCSFNLPDREQSVSTLPATLQFHDIANKHAMKYLQEPTLIKSVSDVESTRDANAEIVAKAGAGSEVEIEPEAEPKAEAGEEEAGEDQDEYYDDDGEEEEEDDDDDDDEDMQQGPGGVTHLLKGWLGFSLSK